MRITQEEREYPSEWLERLLEDRKACARLLLESGGLGKAAYRVARAQCSADTAGPGAPTVRQLSAAARLIAARTGREADLPISSAQATPREPAQRSAMPLPPSRRAAS